MMPSCVELLAQYEDQQAIVAALNDAAGLANQAAADAQTQLQDIMNQMVSQGCFGGGA